MTDKPVIDRLANIIHEYTGCPFDRIKPESRLVADIGCDSLDLVEIVMGVEEEFGTEITDEEAEEIVTVGDAIKLIESKL